MANPTEPTIDAALLVLTTLAPKAVYDRHRRVDRAINAAGDVIDKAPRERLWTAPDGSQWVERIDNTGARIMKKVT